MAENSNTESAEEEARKSSPSSPIIKPNIKPKAQFKHNADAIWKKRIAESAFEVEEEKDPDRPVVPLNASERPTNGMAVPYVAGKEDDLIRYAFSIDLEEDGEYLIASTLISQCILHCHLNHAKDDLNSLLNQIFLKFSHKEKEVKTEIIEFKLENPTDYINEDGQVQNAVGMMMCRIPLMIKIFSLASNAAEISVFTARGLELDLPQIGSLRDLSQRLIMCGIELIIDVLVLHFEELIDASPFEMSRPYGVQSVYDATLEVMRTTRVTVSLLKSTFKYLFTFVSNCLMEMLTEHENYENLAWSIGVRLRGNLDTIHQWAEQYGLGADFKKVSLKLSEAADLVATPRSQLAQICSAVQLKRRYGSISTPQMSKIINRLKDAPNEAMKPIVQELNDLASVAEGRFTAGIKEQKTKLPNISLSNHDKPQTIALMTRRHVMDHGVFISGKAINTTNFLDNPSYTETQETSSCDVSIEASLDTEQGVVQKSLTLRPNGEKLGINLTWGMETGLKEAGLYVQAVHSYGIADVAGCVPGDRIVSINSKSLLSCDYETAINMIKTAGKEFTLNVLRHKQVCDRERITELLHVELDD